MAINYKKSSRERERGPSAIVQVEHSAVRVDYIDEKGFTSWVVHYPDYASYSRLTGILIPNKRRTEMVRALSWKEATSQGKKDRKLRARLGVTVVEAGLTTHAIMKPL